MKSTRSKMKFIAIAILLACLEPPASSAQDNVDTEELVKVGIIAPLSGDSAYFGTVISNGVEIGLDTAKESLAIRKLDDEGQARTAVECVRKLDSWGAAIIIGPCDSHTTAAAAAEAKRLEIPIVSPSATASYLKVPTNEWLFRAITSDQERASQLAHWIKEDHSENPVLVIHEVRNADSKHLSLIHI